MEASCCLEAKLTLLDIYYKSPMIPLFHDSFIPLLCISLSHHAWIPGGAGLRSQRARLHRMGKQPDGGKGQFFETVAQEHIVLFFLGKKKHFVPLGYP